MQATFTVLLLTVLGAAVMYFVAMALVQLHRTRALAAEASRRQMHFDADDPFDIPRRYSDFALMSSGHSPQATNVTYGHIDARLVRGFDFRYEVAHGTRRMTRHYGVIVAELKAPLGSLIMWNDQDIETAPLALQQADGRAGRWIYKGETELPQVAADCFASLAGEGLGLEIRGSTLMAFMPARRRHGDYARQLTDVLRSVNAIDVAPSDEKARDDDSPED